MLQDYDLRDLGNKIYKNEILGDTWEKQMNTINGEFVELDKTSISRTSCVLNEEVEFTCSHLKFVSHTILRLGLKIYTKKDIPCLRLICDSANNMVYFKGKITKDKSIRSVTILQYERDRKQMRVVSNFPVNLKGQYRSRELAYKDYGDNLFD
jgi:hypothetical protein